MNNTNEKKINYSDRFTNLSLSNAVESLEASIESFDATYKRLCNALSWFDDQVNEVKNELLSSETRNLVYYINNLSCYYGDFVNTNVHNTWGKTIRKLEKLNTVLESQVDFEYEDEESPYPCIKQNDYLDFVDFIYRNLSNKPTYEEKKIIEDKFKELDDYLKRMKFDVLEDNPFSKITYK